MKASARFALSASSPLRPSLIFTCWEAGTLDVLSTPSSKPPGRTAIRSEGSERMAATEVIPFGLPLGVAKDSVETITGSE
ncbi:hypothetical protein D9M72_650260 [compost metagenome]